MTEMNASDVHDDVLGVVLAGGLSRRFGGADKALQSLAGRPLIAHVCARAKPQVGRLIVNAPREPVRFGDLGGDGLAVVADVVDGALGPLAGVLTGMAWAREHMAAARWIATFATDAPFLPPDMVARLKAAAVRVGADIALAQSGGREHPVSALWSVDMFDDLDRAVRVEGMRKVFDWLARRDCVSVTFDTHPVDPFFNVNTPEDLARAEDLARVLSGGA